MSDHSETIVIATIRIRRTLMHLSPFALRAWLLFKNCLFASGLGLTITQVWMPDFLAPMRIPAQLTILWAVQSLLLSRHQPGTSYLLVTTRGLLISDLSIYLDWEDVDSYTAGPDLVRVRTKAGVMPGWSGRPQTLDVPLTPAIRTDVKDAFREYVGLPRIS